MAAAHVYRNKGERTGDEILDVPNLNNDRGEHPTEVTEIIGRFPGIWPAMCKRRSCKMSAARVTPSAFQVCVGTEKTGGCLKEP